MNVRFFRLIEVSTKKGWKTASMRVGLNTTLLTKLVLHTTMLYANR